MLPPMTFTTTDARRKRDDPTRMGSPVNFAAFVRAAAVQRNSAVIVPEGVRIQGFVVPRDGVWMIDRRWVEPGTDVGTLLPGTVVHFHATGVDMSLREQHDPRHPVRRQARVGLQSDPRVVRQSRLYDHRGETLLPRWAGAYLERPSGLFGPRGACKRAG